MGGAWRRFNDVELSRAGGFGSVNEATTRIKPGWKWWLEPNRLWAEVKWCQDI